MASEQPDITEAELEEIYDKAEPFDSEEEMDAAIDQLNAYFALAKSALKIERTINIRRSETVEKANPYHDERGRFTSANAAVGGAGMRSGGKKLFLRRGQKSRRSKTTSEENRQLLQRQADGTKTRAEAQGVETGVYAINAARRGTKMDAAQAGKKMLKDYDKMYNSAVKRNDPDPQGAADAAFTKKYRATVLQVENVLSLIGDVPSGISITRVVGAMQSPRSRDTKLSAEGLRSGSADRKSFSAARRAASRVPDSETGYGRERVTLGRGGGGKSKGRGGKARRKSNMVPKRMKSKSGRARKMRGGTLIRRPDSD